MRSFRYYGKKRGHRRTGSPALASIGEAIFWAILLLLGCGGLVLLFGTLVVPEWRVNHEFVETTCKVLDKRIDQKRGDEGLLYRPEIRIEYEVGGTIYRDWHYDIHRAYSSGRPNAQSVLDGFEEYSPSRNNRYPCWYDLSDPSIVVLVRGYRWWVWLAFTVPISFMVIGAGGLIYKLLHWGKSAERRAAMTQWVQDRDLLGANGGNRAFPGVPQGADMTNSPGTRLRFRLPMTTSPGWVLVGTLLLCVVWNGIVWTLVIIGIRGFMAGHADWLLTLFMIPFVVIGLGGIVLFMRQLATTTGIGPTLMEISDHPLYPGGQYHLFLSLSGRLTINAIHVSLTCEEVATYRQGTNSRTESQAVYRQELFRREGFQIQSGLPFEAEFDLNVPAGAMHSFKADHNEINWALVVEGDIAGWRPYKRSFSVVVRPANGELDR